MRHIEVVVAFIAGVAIATPAAAQVIERPVAFDSAGQMKVITPAIALRLNLRPPAWPVTGPFVDARLFDAGSDRYIIAVQQTGGAIARYELTASARGDLQRAITSAMLATGNLTTGERRYVVSEPAKGQFVRDQVLASTLLYGPSLASLAHNGQSGVALYLATVGASFFTSAQIAKEISVSKAQNHMVTNGVGRGAAIAAGLVYVAQGDSANSDVVRLSLVAGGITGTVLGFRAGRSFTDGEAHGATFGSTMSMLTTAGLIGVGGGWKPSERRAQVGGLIAASLAGYPLGLRYARRASYAITPGDVSAMSAAAGIGVLGAATFLRKNAFDNHSRDAQDFGVLTAGLLGGAWLGDRVLVRPWDFTESQGRLLGLGAIAGGLIGIAFPVVSDAKDGRVYFGLGAVGAWVGMALTMGILEPAKGARRGAASESEIRDAFARSHRPGERRLGRAVVSFHPENAGLFFSKPKARIAVPLVSVRY